MNRVVWFEIPFDESECAQKFYKDVFLYSCMNKTTMTFALVIAIAAVFAVASPLNVAVAQTAGDTMPDGEGEKGDYKDGEHKDGKSCPNKERKSAVH